MRRRPPRFKLTNRLLPYTTIFRSVALIAARDLPAERQLARTLADARPGDMVGRTVEAAAARDSRRNHVRRVDVDLGIAEAIACADVQIADPPRERRSGI